MERTEMKPVKKQSQLREFWRVFSANKPAVIGLIIILFMFGVALFADQIVPYSEAIEQHMTAEERLIPPNSEHIFGTDSLGRDVFARIVHGGKISLTMGFIPTIVSMGVGMLLGACAAYFGGFIDNIIMRICDVFACIPGVLLSMTFAAVLGSGLRNMMIAITISGIPGCIRFVRALILNIVEADYIEAAKACGTGNFVIMIRHVLPNAVGPLVLNTVSSIAGMIMMGAGLSFLGLGIQPPQPEWGYMLSEAREFMLRAPYLFFIPGFAMLISILSLNLAGDGLRDALDPKLRR